MLITAHVNELAVIDELAKDEDNSVNFIRLLDLHFDSLEFSENVIRTLIDSLNRDMPKGQHYTLEFHDATTTSEEPKPEGEVK